MLDMNEPVNTDEQDARPTGRHIPLSWVWQAMPRVVRRAIVAVVGITLVLLGLALIVLPGPFTIPLLIAGFFVLGTEFAWAAAALAKTRRGLEWATDKTKSIVRVATRRPSAPDEE